MFVVSIVVFALVRLSGDPIQIMMPAEASKADIELMRAHLGLDRPWHVQYWKFAIQALQGDFGRSVRFRRPALDLIAGRYGATLELGGLAVLVVIVVALPVGVYSAVRRGSALDYGARSPVAAATDAGPQRCRWPSWSCSCCAPCSHPCWHRTRRSRARWASAWPRRSAWKAPSPATCGAPIATGATR